ncbi:hypothetical protein MBOT_26720 [Mycobacterium botniense]|uniref:Uncharacterized protein n=1 Tax=Mycobacterium botniense TaxID=84962 RepID=A0A7I9XZZ8_9MYCO|nr:hypothetical protein MBOT_26720 [Mycobacterium botniense]
MNGAVGAAASAPAIPAVISALRTLFNIAPFALRAPKHLPLIGARGSGSGGMGASRRTGASGTTAGHGLPNGAHPWAAERLVTVRSPAHTRVSGFDFGFGHFGRKAPYETGLH